MGTAKAPSRGHVALPINSASVIPNLDGYHTCILYACKFLWPRDETSMDFVDWKPCAKMFVSQGLCNDQIEKNRRAIENHCGTFVLFFILVTFVHQHRKFISIEH